MAIRLDTSDRKRLVITFLLEPDQPPGAVSVVGSFNEWTPGRHQLQSDADDPTRRAAVAVPYGAAVHFRYLAADGVWFDDPEATLTSPGTLRGRICVRGEVKVWPRGAFRRTRRGLSGASR